MNRFLLLMISALVLGGASFGLGQPQAASAAPAGAATSLSAYSQNCQSNGTVQTRFSWQPGGAGVQWFDLSTLNNNFAAGWYNAGPMASSQNSIEWNGLSANTVYYARVNTFVNGAWASSDTLVFQTPNCGGSFTAPDDLDSTVLGPNSVRWNWDSGTNNSWFCVDTALSPSDLTTFSGSFGNWGCGTTTTTVTGNALLCGTKHYWRVYAAGPAGSGHSAISEFTTASCNFTAPTDLDATVEGPSKVKFTFDRGNDNLYICIDTAQSEDDLTGITGTFMNHGCGISGETYTSNVVPCGVTSYWRVWAAGTNTTGYSAIESFTTPACPFTAPTNLDADTIDGDTIHYEWTKGVDNLWSCVDTAESESDLDSLSGTWANHGCGTTADELTVNGLDCGTTYYWRVFARGSGGSSGSSVVETSETAACP